MGFHLPPGTTVGGVPVSRIKRAASRGFSHPDDAAAFDALAARGWASRNENGDVVTSREGNALAAARLRRRVPLADADKAFARLRAGIDAIAEEGIFLPEVWIFGSYMRRDAFVGDLDVSIGLHTVGDHDDALRAIAERYGHTAWHAARARDRNRWMHTAYAHHVAFGDRMPPIFDGVGFDLESVVVGWPVQRIRDPHAGWVTEPILPKHPDARLPMPPAKPLTVLTDQGPVSRI